MLSTVLNILFPFRQQLSEKRIYRTDIIKLFHYEGMTYTIKILGLQEYYNYMWKAWGRKMFSLTDTYYPVFFALGWCSHRQREIVVCKVLNWKLRLLHEQGHSVGLKHVPVWQVGYVMHPWGFCRGWKGKEEIENLLGFSVLSDPA
jgi:hypothetical protein